MIITAPGIYDIPLRDYLLDPVVQPSLSHSLAVTGLTRCWRVAWEQHPRLNPAWRPAPPGDFDFASAVHAYVLGQGNVHVLDFKNWKTDASKQQRQLAREHGMLPVLNHEMRRIEAIEKAIRVQCAQFPEPKPLTDGKAEQTLVWTETIDGRLIWLRARPDWMHTHSATLDDLKVTGNAHPAEWGRKLFDRGYDVQDALYRRGYKALKGVEPSFRFAVVDDEAPYAMSLVALDPEASEFADERVEIAIQEWANCLATGTWPGYADRVAYQQLPPWVKARWEERRFYA